MPMSNIMHKAQLTPGFSRKITYTFRHPIISLHLKPSHTHRDRHKHVHTYMHDYIFINTQTIRNFVKEECL